MHRVAIGKLVYVTVLLACLGGMSACGTVSKGIAPDGKSARQLIFPDPSDALVKGGTFPSVENLRSMAPGMTKDQLYTMYGPPHFHEGVWRVHEWDYLFNFRVNNLEQPFVTCEYKILFDRNNVAESFYWKPASCAALVEAAAPAAVARQAPAPPPAPLQKFVLSTDTMFAFNKAHLSVTGEHQLDELIERMRSYGHIDNLHVTGYADRIGTDQYNLDLSRKRAGAVRNYLMRRGVPDGVIDARGRGEDDPLVTCMQKGHASLVRCLAPNRRVEILGEVTK